jgi:LysM repeat protein
MQITKLIHLTIAVAVLAVVAAAPQPALAWGGGCGNTYYVQWGDTLGKLAVRYGTTVAALRAANPSLGYWLYAGQTICIPDGGGYGYDGCYQGWGGYGQGCGDGYGYNDGYGYGYGYSGYGYDGYGYDGYGHGYNDGYGHDGYGRDYGGTYVVRRGDTLAKIAAAHGTTWRQLLALNPQIWNPNWIYAGQVIRLW